MSAERYTRSNAVRFLAFRYFIRSSHEKPELVTSVVLRMFESFHEHVFVLSLSDMYKQHKFRSIPVVERSCMPDQRCIPAKDEIPSYYLAKPLKMSAAGFFWRMASVVASQPRRSRSHRIVFMCSWH